MGDWLEREGRVRGRGSNPDYRARIHFKGILPLRFIFGYNPTRSFSFHLTP
jgi:hypothetical protein